MTLAPLVDASLWLVGYSGGVDSLVLLHLVHQWRKQHDSVALPPLRAIHIDHGLSAQSSDWQRCCEQICNELHVGLISRRVAVGAGASQEAAAREARYAAFTEALPEGGVLMLGHHLDDQVETVFLRLLRGTGTAGLGGIPAKRSLGCGRLVRPLLEVPRSVIEAYADAHQLDYVTDESNVDTRFDRNFLRQAVLPLIAQRWPAYRRTVGRAAAHLADAEKRLRAQRERLSSLTNVMDDPGVAVSALVAEEGAALLRDWLAGLGKSAPDQSVLQEFLRQLNQASSDAAPLMDCGQYRLQRYADAVYLLPIDKPPPKTTLDVLLTPDVPLHLDGVGELCLRQTAGPGFLLSSEDAVMVTWRRGGERVRIVGASGSTTVKKLLQSKGVPPWWRSRVPLLMLAGECLAIGDIALCDSPRFRGVADGDGPRWNLQWKRPVRN